MSELTELRADRWLWAARFYKTRQLAIKALKNGKVSKDRLIIKPSTSIKIGDQLNIKQQPYQKTIIVDSLRDKRGSAKIAQSLYHETTESIAAREDMKLKLASQPKVAFEQRKPDKRGVRSKRQLKRQLKSGG